MHVGMQESVLFLALLKCSRTAVGEGERCCMVKVNSVSRRNGWADVDTLHLCTVLSVERGGEGA